MKNRWSFPAARLPLVVVLAALSLAPLFAGGSRESAPAQSKQVTLRWLQTAATQPEIEQWRELAADVTKKFPNIVVQLETTDWNNYWTKLPAEIASGNTADILYMQNLRTKGFVTQGCVPLDGYIKDDKDLNFQDYIKGIVDGLSVDGKVYGLPYDIGPYVLIYNKDLFDKYGVPYPDEKTDLAGFLDRARKLTRDGNYGFAASIHWDRLVPFIWGAGGTFYYENGKYDVLDPKVQQGIKFYTDLLTTEKVSAPINDTGNQYQDREVFYAGKAGMYVDGPWNITNIRKFAKFKFDIAPMPIGPDGKRVTPTMGSGFTVSKFSKFPKEAYQAITVLTSRESMEKLANWGRALPARASAQPQFLKANADLTGLAKALEVSAQPGVSRAYSTPHNWQEAYLTLLNNLSQPVLLGKESVAEAAAKTQKLLDAIR